MIKELSNFINSLDPEFKALGLKAKEGLHILLTIQSENETLFMNDNSIVQWCFTRKKDPTPDDITFLKECAALSQLSWCVNTNKCFDLPIKAIHSCSPYCVAIKRENLAGGDKYKNNRKSQVYERVGSYFDKAVSLLDDETDKQRIKPFEQALDSEAKFNYWLSLIPDYDLVKDAEYVIFYLDEPIENYERANAKYLKDKLFNTNDYNETTEDSIYGTSDFFNGYPTKKPFLTHQSAYFDIASRISAQEAKDLYDFQDIIGRRILPNPLPIFIDEDEIVTKGKKSLKDASIALFKKEAEQEQGGRIGYKEIIETLFKDYEGQLGNYYLLFYDRGVIKDFDFVPKFEYWLGPESGKEWEIQDWFDIGYRVSIKDVFHLQQAVLLPVFNNALVTKTKSGGFQYKYFDDLDSKYCKSDVTFLLVQQYRKAFYDFIYKSKRQAVTQEMFDYILQTSILEDIRLDEIKNVYHTQDRYIKEKMSILFSLSEKFNLSNAKNNTTMASKLKEHREFIKKLTKGESHIESDDQYAFAIGQVIYYLLSKSKTADKSYKRLEPFVQQVHSKELNKAIYRMFDSYKHENFSTNFRSPFAEVMDYETTANVRDFMPTILAGIFSKNELFSDKEQKEVAEVVIEQDIEE
jgi:CRISPR-associated protein Csh1